MAHGKRRRAGMLAVVLDEFPSLSETFILRELLALQQRGFELLPLALRRPSAQVSHADTQDLANRTIYRSPCLSLRCLWHQFVTFLRYPAGYISAWLFVMGNALGTPSAARELVVSLLAAGDFAATIPRRQRVAHIHAQFCSMTATVGLLLAEVLGRTFSMSCHARDIFTREAHLLGHKLSEAEFSTVCTRIGQERLLRQHRLAVRDRLHLIYHGIDPTRFMPSPTPPPPPRVVLSVGRLVPKKGFDILLRAAALARGHGAEFELHIVGDGPERQDLEHLAGGLGLRDVVVFHGALSQEALLPLYHRAHAFALASIVTEDGDRDGVPNVLIEALATGVPAVATAVGGIPEIIIHGETGLLAQPGDPAAFAEQLERILHDEELRDHVRRAGRAKVALEFDSSRNIEQLAALLEAYVEPRAQGSERQAGAG